MRLFSNGREVFVGPFVGRFTANVCRAVANSLRTPDYQRTIEFALDRDSVGMRVDGRTVDLDAGQGFARTITRETLKGMVRELKGVDPSGALRIEVDLGEEIEKEG